MSISVNQRVKKHRDKLKASGLRPIQIWVPDTGKKGFAKECDKQCKIIAKDTKSEKEIMDWMDEVRDSEGWIWE